jgi:NAD(P)-dependent dehydrogenase (short-subunit alcohol dehydrogenase family)
MMRLRPGAPLNQMLKGRVIVITGAGRGIGREIALLCAQEGAAVVVNDFGGAIDGEGSHAGPAQDVVGQIVSAGGRAVANVSSVADPAGARSIIDDAIKVFGKIDGVVNNAGILRDAIFHKMSDADWRAVIDTHLHGAFMVSHAAAAHFKEQRSGAYVHFTSTSGLVGNIGQANYAAAKMGIVGLSTGIAIDMQRFNVRSNCIAPFAWSRMLETVSPQTEEQRIRIEKAKTMTPAKVAPLAAFLVSDLAKEVTGEVFSVRKNEIFLFSKPRPVRSIHRAEGWSIDTLASDLLPAMRPSLHPLEVTADVFSWDPI